MNEQQRVVRPIVIKLRVSKREAALWNKAARATTEGNVSSFVRRCANVAAQQAVGEKPAEPPPAVEDEASAAEETDEQVEALFAKQETGGRRRRSGSAG